MLLLAKHSLPNREVPQMSNADQPTDIITIRRWANWIKNSPHSNCGPGELAVADFVLANTNPITMEDVNWNDKEHRGAGATDTITGKTWVMIQDIGDQITCIDLDMGIRSILASELIPDEKKYTIVEISDNPEHSETLCTVEDYEICHGHQGCYNPTHRRPKGVA